MIFIQWKLWEVGADWLVWTKHSWRPEKSGPGTSKWPFPGQERPSSIVAGSEGRSFERSFWVCVGSIYTSGTSIVRLYMSTHFLDNWISLLPQKILSWLYSNPIVLICPMNRYPEGRRGLHVQKIVQIWYQLNCLILWKNFCRHLISEERSTLYSKYQLSLTLNNCFLHEVKKEREKKKIYIFPSISGLLLLIFWYLSAEQMGFLVIQFWWI